MSTPADGKPRKQSYALAFGMLGELGIEIALPVVVFTMVGKRIDLAYGTQPKAVIGAFVLAFSVSAMIIWKRAKAMQRMYMDDSL